MILNMAGGGAGINLKVKAYSSPDALLADAAPNNTIGVVTSNMTDYRIRNTGPAHSAGLVWITTGTSSRNGTELYVDPGTKYQVCIYPLRARISDGSAWSDIPMYIRKNGEWQTPWMVYLQDGVGVNELEMRGTNTAIDANGLNLSATSASTSKPERHAATAFVDLSPYRNMHIKVYTNMHQGYSSCYFRMGVAGTDYSQTFNINTWASYADLRPTNAQGAGTYEYDLDISKLSGNAYIQVMVYAPANRTCYVYDWRLEP